MKRITIWFLVLVGVAVFASNVYAEVPQLINYQGILTDLSGAPIDGTHDLTFRIYADPTDPTALWTEVHSGVYINEGLFSEILGGITPFPEDLFANGERWVGITVDSDLEIAPRKRLISVPWALRAATADSVLSAPEGTCDGHSLDAADGDPVDAIYVNNEGKVGIGTSNPWATLDVVSNDGITIHSPSSGYGMVHIRPYHPGSTELVHEIRAAGWRETIRFGPNEDGSATDVQVTGELRLRYGYGYGMLSMIPYHPGMTEPVHQIRTGGGNETIRFGPNEDGSEINVEVQGFLSTGILEITGGSDLAEPFPVQDSNTMEPGMVVSIDPRNPGDLKLATEPYDYKVVGVISGAKDLGPGLVMGNIIQNDEDSTVNVALTGRVWCWADASKEPITPGDLLTTSPNPGHAMKAIDYEKAKGAIIGKAMTSLASGTDLVLVLVTLQ